MEKLTQRGFFVFLFFCSINSFAQATNSGQLDYEAAIRLLKEGAASEALVKFDKLIYSGFSDDRIYKYRGIARFNLNDFQGAAEDLHKANQKAENDPETLGLIGICKYHFHEWEAAKYFLINALSAGYKNSKAELYLGYLYFDGHQYREVVEYLNRAEKGGEKEIRLFEARGIAAYYNGDFILAINDLERVMKGGKATLAVFETLGLSYVSSEKASKAMFYLKKADSLSSKNKDVYFQLGNCLKDKKQFVTAIESYSKAIALNYTEAAVFLNRGEAKVMAGLAQESLVDFEKAINLRPEDNAGYRGRARANMKLADWSKVVTDLSIANALGGTEPDDLFLLSLAKYNLKNYQGALDDVNALVAKGVVELPVDGKKYSVKLQKGKCLVALRQFESAISYFEEAQKEGNRTADLYLNRARAYVGLQQLEKAIADLEKAQLADPKNADVFYNSAVIKEEVGDTGAAILDYNKALRLNPKDALAYYGRASSKARNGDNGAAIVDMDEAIKLDDTNAAYYKARANYYYQIKNKDKACFDWRKAVEFGDEKARFSIDQYCNKK